MKLSVTGLRAVLLGAAVVAGSTAAAPGAHAKSHRAHAPDQVTTSRVTSSRVAVSRVGAGFDRAAGPGAKHLRIGGHGRKTAWIRGGNLYAAETDATGETSSLELGSYGGMSCVPFARANSGIELAGNAAAWWSAAAGVYERGSRPEVGSILNFRANGRMHSGHVAVVSAVENPRVVEIDHANWSGHGAVTRNVTVVDVSPFNDWSAVRVALNRAGTFGSVYPTFGFIYDRPDHGLMVANTTAAPMPALANAAPRDLRPAIEQVDATASDEPVEVAEATMRSSYRRHGRSTGGRHEQAGRAKAGRTVVAGAPAFIHSVSAHRVPAVAAHSHHQHARS